MGALHEMARSVRHAWYALSALDTKTKDDALRAMADALERESASILEENAKDLVEARAKGRTEAFLERLTLTPARIHGMAEGLRSVALLPDPVGEEVDAWMRPNGLQITRRRVPIGVIAIIYESRPNVTADAAALCIKSGNAVILRGGSDAFLSNQAILGVMQRAGYAAGLPEHCMELVVDVSREAATELMRMNDCIDVLIPRGGKGLIQSVVQNATVPVIQTGDGVCHVYVDGACEREMALRVAVSAKVSRPSVCNSAETLLVDSAVAADFLPECVRRLRAEHVEVRGCERVRAICPDVKIATEEDWDTEYNDLIYSVRVVDGVEAAIAHINQHGTRHSEAILTQDEQAARRFLAGVDAAAVYVNASTRFTDGGEFGFGAEIGISNQKLHARGPMGLRELTTVKYEIVGNGQIR